MKVINDLLNINNLKIVQDTDYFNFSLDSVILSDYVNPRKGDKIIDFCSGNCPVPMILSTKTKDKIIGVELQKEVGEIKETLDEHTVALDALIEWTDNVQEIVRVPFAKVRNAK